MTGGEDAGRGRIDQRPWWPSTARTRKFHDQLLAVEADLPKPRRGCANLIANGVIVRDNTVISKLNLPYLEALVPFLAGQFPEVRHGPIDFSSPQWQCLQEF